MGEVTIIGVDLAKNMFLLHAVAAGRSVVFRKKLPRPHFARFMAEHSPCPVAMQTCVSAYHWAREMARRRHAVRLSAAHHATPFVKRPKNDAADAEAIVEAALRLTMRLAEPNSTDQQVRAVAFRMREQLVKQRAEAEKGLRSHLCAFGHVAAEGIGFVPLSARVIEDPDADMPELARDVCRMLIEQIAHLQPLRHRPAALHYDEGVRRDRCAGRHAGCIGQ